MADDDLMKLLIEKVDSISDRMDKVVRDEEMHDDHHDWVKSQMHAAQARAEFWEDVRKKVATAGIWGCIVLVCSVAWYAFRQFVQHNGHT